MTLRTKEWWKWYKRAREAKCSPRHAERTATTMCKGTTKGYLLR